MILNYRAIGSTTVNVVPSPTVLCTETPSGPAVEILPEPSKLAQQCHIGYNPLRGKRHVNRHH